MRKTFLIVLASISLIACKETTSKKKTTSPFPEHLSRVFEMHGGIDKWKELRQLSFDVKNEKHQVDLHSRKSLISADTYSVGFDGKNAWMQQKEEGALKAIKIFITTCIFIFMQCLLYWQMMELSTSRQNH